MNTSGNSRARFTFLLVMLIVVMSETQANKQDSVYLFAYSVNEGRSGLTLAWSLDREEWHAIGPEHCFLFSDFGRWGGQKRMFSPFLFQDETGIWHCYWTLNDDIHQFAHAASVNLYEWGRQSYPIVMSRGNVHDLEVAKKEDGYRVSWINTMDDKQQVYTAQTADFRHYTPTEKGNTSDRRNSRMEVEIAGVTHRGMVNKVSWELVEALIKHEEWTRYHNSERAESMADDPQRFAWLKPLEATISPEPGDAKEISDMFIGIFFEDISYAADGGLYAELVQNRDFEYQLSEKQFMDPSWTPKKAWKVNGEITFRIDTLDPVHPNNKHYAVLEVGQDGGTLVNEGWDGIPVEEGKQYDFSMIARSVSGTKGTVKVLLRDQQGQVAGTATVKVKDQEWKKYTAVIRVSKTATAAQLELKPGFAGVLELDMISLFPQHTFRNRKNGLRADLAQVIADLNPTFVRFPGGCVAHGDGLDNMYRWENTIGPLESRVPQMNIWRYHQSAGLGYYEYFQFCEDIGAEPIPVVPAGVPCQNSSTGGHGQQCGIPMGEMDTYVQSVLNLVEWANGDEETEWGRKRAEAGHPEPFHLKYIGVGNEDLITDVFEERFTMIYNALREHHPEITVIGTVGPFYMGTDYEEGWDLARKLDLPMVDEHYYQTPGWFINNQDFYDKYDRQGPKVYLGEYAAHVSGRRTNMETALSEALYLTAVERNADVVRMTSYAPLLAREGHTNWNPDLIYFNNTEVKPTVGYYVQQLYGQHAGNTYIPSQIHLSERNEEVRERFGVSMVQDVENGDLIIRLVNLLPVEIQANIDLEEFGLKGTGTTWIMQGTPAEENVLPEKREITVPGDLGYTVPAYSFTVIRLHAD